ncbi:OmpH family outer membrane protein [Novosphingobium bradum]|uniref:OmpH family outer membrane protein n=1 Tax=Novosphingobium bradum TaxID=1737444 RepID=A0ABV7IX58_9SPHN
MTKLLTSAALGAALALGAATPVLAAPAAAAAGPEIAYANPDGVIQASNAFRVANQQRQTTYKAQYDAFEKRRGELEAQMQGLQQAFEKARTAPGANQAALQQQAQQIQALQQSAQAELQQITQPIVYSQAYVQEQLAEKMPAAVNAAMTKRGVKLLLSQESVILESPSYNLNPAIVAELNALIPNAQIVPPAGWEPRQVREARAQQQGAAPAAPSTAAQPSGR